MIGTPARSRAPTRFAAGSTAVRPLLRGPTRDLEVLAAFPAAAYLADPATGRTELAVVSRDGIAHPNALVLVEVASAEPLRDWRPGREVTVGRGTVRLGGGDQTVAVARWFDPRPTLALDDPRGLAERAAALRPALARVWPPIESELARRGDRVAHALVAGDGPTVAHAGAELVGRGPGLTPAGDDLLAGILATAALLAPWDTPPPAVATVLASVDRRTTSVSAALLRHAALGRVATPVAVLLRALVAGRAPTGPALDAVLSMGATSGRDLTVGLLAAIEAWYADAPPVPAGAPALRRPS